MRKILLLGLLGTIFKAHKHVVKMYGPSEAFVGCTV